VILDQLKTGTASVHASLERRLLLAQAPSVSAYWSYLVAMHGFVAPLEAGFRRLPAPVQLELELPRREKADLIASDLDALAARVGTSADRAPWCDALPAHGSVAEALGVLYVLEGSTLGARWLLRHVAPLGVEECAAYLRSYGDAVGPMWQKMRAFLAAYSEKHPDEDAAIEAAARGAFERIDAWFVRCGAAEVSRAA
jgi:heme oxygenase (biliverdin-IX-beta and delta-forming)